MANQLSPDKRRVTYTEWKDVYKIIEVIAKKERLDVSDVIRRATLEYAQKLQNDRKK